MELTHLTLLLALPPLVVVSGACSAAETALFSLGFQDRARLRRESPGAAAAAAYLLARPRALLVSLILTNTLVNTLYFVITSIVTLGVENPWLGIALTVFNLVLLTVMAEVVSKMLAAQFPVAFTRLLARPVLVVFRSLGPVRQFLEVGVLAPLSRLLTPRRGAAPTLTPEELEALVRIGERRGEIDADEQRMLRQVIALGDMRVRDVMVPRTRMEWLASGCTAEEVEELWRRTRLTRVPLCDESIDRGVVGMLNVKGFLLALALWRERGESAGAPPAPRPADFLEEARFVPQTATLDRLLEHFRVTATKVGLCVDEHGAVTGVVSAQSAARPLMAGVGPEAAANGEAAPQVEMVGLGRWRVSGSVSVREWRQMFNLEADPRVSTVAGLVFARLGRVPVVGDRVRLGNVQIEVLAVAGRVAETVQLRLITEQPAPDRAGDGVSPGDSGRGRRGAP